MEWQISYLSDRDIMLVTVTGLCDATNTLPMIKAMREEAQRLNCLKWLLDSRTAVRYYSTVDYYNRPDVYNSLDISTAVSVAVVFEEVGRQERFYGTVCRNRGFNVSVFSDIDAAIAWLTSLPEDSSHRGNPSIFQERPLRSSQYRSLPWVKNLVRRTSARLPFHDYCISASPGSAGFSIFMPQS